MNVGGQLGSIGYMLGVFERNIYTRGAKIRILRPLLSRLDPGGIGYILGELRLLREHLRLHLIGHRGRADHYYCPFSTRGASRCIIVGHSS